MICCTFQGRLGNQFFQYAFVRSLYESRGRIDNLVFNFEYVKSLGNETQGWTDALKDFCVLPYEISESKLVIKYSSSVQRIAYIFVMGYIRLLRCVHIQVNDERCFRRLYRYGFYYQDMYNNDGDIGDISRQKVLFVFGHFENSMYFSSIKPILQQEFQPKYPLIQKNNDLINRIRQTNSVCVSIRHGKDYLGTQLDICGLQYVQKAIAKMLQLVDSPTFFFFSDDIEWTKNNITVNAPSFYEDGKDPVWEKLRLMASCSHFIISNSTFSWWAQFLGSCETKVVISPSKWINKDIDTFLVEESFIRIDA